MEPPRNRVRHDTVHSMAYVVPDDDPHRLGVQLVTDLWVVWTSDGVVLIAAPNAALAERWTVYTLLSGGAPNPKIRSVRLASEEEAVGFVADIAAKLGIPPGPIPIDMLDSAADMLGRTGPLRLATYRQLTERTNSDATALPSREQWTEPQPLRVPKEYHIDVRRVAYLSRNLLWVVAWVAVAVAPVLLAAVSLLVWPPTLGPWLEGIDRVLVRVAVPVVSVSFVWALLWFAGTHHALFARFNMWPDRGGTFERDYTY